MEPLATLGDAVLDLVVIQRLYQKGKRKEGGLSQDKVKEIKKERTCAIARRLHYQKYVRWGKGEQKDEIWNKGAETFDTCIEALIGAVYLDAQMNRRNGIKYSEKVLERWDFFRDSK
jgi:ribonuclease-3